MYTERTKSHLGLAVKNKVKWDELDGDPREENTVENQFSLARSTRLIFSWRWRTNVSVKNSPVEGVRHSFAGHFSFKCNCVPKQKQNTIGGYIYYNCVGDKKEVKISEPPSPKTNKQLDRNEHFDKNGSSNAAYASKHENKWYAGIICRRDFD